MGNWLLTNANDILIDLNGERAYLEDNTLWVYSGADLDNATAVMTFNKTDLGEPGIDKLLNEFIFDYVGQLDLYVYDDNGTSPIWQKTLDAHASRSLQKYYFPLIKRRAFKKMYMTLITNNPNTKLYGIEIDFQILKQRSYA